MERIYDSLKDLICPVMIRRSSQVVGEKEANVSKASESIIASLLGVMLKKGDTPQIRNLLDEASNLNILADSDNICQERPTEDQRRIGDDFLQHLLGDKAADFSNPIAAHAGVSKVATNRLVAMIAPLVAGHLGNLLQKDSRNLPQLLRQIKEEKRTFASYIPSNLIQSFGLASYLNNNDNGTVYNTKTEEKKKGGGWLLWLILIALLLLLIFWWRSCSGTDTTVRNDRTMRDTVSTTRVMPAAAATATATNTTTRADRDTMRLELANRQSITVYKGGIEEEMVEYLNSDNYRNAKENDLKDKWFEFDNIAFEFNSTDKLMDDSRTHSRAQLNNIIAILKSYPNAKIKIAGFADKRGSEDVNLEISKKRAKTIEQYFENAGVGSQIARVEGYGDEYATRSANAPDSERAKDRDIALRFVK